MHKSILFVILIFLFSSCTNYNRNNRNNDEVLKLQSEIDNLKKEMNKDNNQIATFLTFQKEDAEEAMNFYVSLFENSKIDNITRWGEGAPSKEGTIMMATFSLNGHPYMCSDSPPIHEWGFTPAVSNFVTCKDVTELERLFTKLSENGKVMMPLNNYGFSQKFGFVEDKFGVSWQLNLP